MPAPFDLKTIPSQPGCYLYRNRQQEIIYIGKAKNLRKRVASYFSKTHDDYKTPVLVKNIVNVETIVTDNEMEALLLEARLIHKHKPKFNIDLKESQRYAYVVITKEKFPRLVTTRVKPKAGEGQVFGPYTSGEARRLTVYLANTIFKLRVCKKLPKTACLLYHIKQCSAPCIGNISAEEYGANVKKAGQLLKGETAALIDQLNGEMLALAGELQYEQARARRDQITALQSISQRQKVELRTAYNQDVINYAVSDTEFVVQLFNINRGIVSGRQEFRFARYQTDLGGFVRQYYLGHDIPEEVVIPEPLDDQEVLATYLAGVAGHVVRFTVPQKGDKLKLLALVRKNIAVSLTRGDSALVELQEQLSLPTLPRVIECFDISNLGPRDVVASMVTFRDGHPDKNNYRRFKIKTVVGQDDFASMAEVVYRRYHRVLADKLPLPDLVLIDGGKGQLGAALGSLRRLGLQLPVAALAKQFEELYTLDRMRPLRLPPSSDALKLVQRVRDEAHRFAITYQRLIRSKNLLK